MMSRSSPLSDVQLCMCLMRHSGTLATSFFSEANTHPKIGRAPSIPNIYPILFNGSIHASDFTERIGNNDKKDLAGGYVVLVY